MQTKTKLLATALVFTLLGFLLNANGPLGRMVWGGRGLEAAAAAPPASLLPLLVGVGLIEALAFGAGAAFLLFGRTWLTRLGGPQGLATAAHLAVSWALLSWVPHSALHQTWTPGDWSRLVGIEYAFHVTLILGAALLALYLARAAPARQAATAPRAASAAQVLAVQSSSATVRRLPPP